MTTVEGIPVKLTPFPEFEYVLFLTDYTSRLAENPKHIEDLRWEFESMEWVPPEFIYACEDEMMHYFTKNDKERDLSGTLHKAYIKTRGPSEHKCGEVCVRLTSEDGTPGTIYLVCEFVRALRKKGYCHVVALTDMQFLTVGGTKCLVVELATESG